MSLSLAAILVAGGLGAGFLTGLLGVGGGVVMVPLLYQVFQVVGASNRVAFTTAVATSLTVMIFTAAYSSRLHRRNGLLDLGLVLWTSFGTMAGSVLGAHLMVISEGRLVRLGFGLFLWAMAASLFLPAASPRPQGFVASSRYRAGLVVTGLGVGTLAALFGIGGTTLLVPALILFFGIAIHQAVATATALIVVTAISGSCSYFYLGLHDPTLFAFGHPWYPPAVVLLMAPGALAASHLGIRVARNFSRNALKLTLILFQIGVGARFVFGS